MKKLRPMTVDQVNAWVMMMYGGMYQTCIKEVKQPLHPSEKFLIGYIFEGFFHVTGYGDSWEKAVEVARIERTVLFRLEA